MRIVYCDDQPIQGVYVKELTAQWQEKTGIPCSVTIYGSAEEFLLETGPSFPFDLALLDIEMDQISGMDLAKKIRRTEKDAAIAFLTGKKEYVFEGYEVQALRYLMKPLQKNDFFHLLDQVQAGLQKAKSYLILNGSGESLRIDTEQIFFLEAVGHYVRIHTSQKDFKVKSTLSGLKKGLPPESFSMAHRSYLVNLARVVQITRTECRMSDKISVPVSRNLYPSLNEAFLNYYKKETGLP